MEFIRNKSSKEVLGIGMINDLPKLMKNSNYSTERYEEILLWSILNKNINVWKYILNLDGKVFGKETINIKFLINSLLWEIVTISERDEFILEILSIPNLFDDIELNLEQTHIHVIYDEKYLSRPNRRVYFGTKLYIDKATEYGNIKGAKALKDYYYKYKK